MAFIWLPFAVFNAYIGLETIRYMDITIKQRNEKLKLLKQINDNLPFKA